MLLPFLAGMTIAYFLAPVVDVLARKKMPRWLGALSVLLGFGIGMGLLILAILPLLISQGGALLDAIPGYIELVRNHYLAWFQDWLTRFPPDDVTKLRAAVAQSAAGAASGPAMWSKAW